MRTLVVVEHDNKHVQPATEHALAAAMDLNAEIDCIVIGDQCQSVAEEIAMFENVHTVKVADHSVYAHQLAENCAALIKDIANDYQYVLAPATTFGKNILPRVAGLLDVAMLSDVVQIVSEDTFIRPIYAGNAMATVKMNDATKLMTIRTTAFKRAKARTDGKASIQALTEVIANHQTTFENHHLTESKRPDLTSARIIISGGRGLKSAENFRLLEDIADCLGAAIGASRAAVDAGFAPNDYQVGQTGKVVAPDLYIAVGISGAIQHLAGMKDSKVIVAINSDPDAPIFQIANYRLVGDLFKILPELRAALGKNACSN